MHEKLGLYEDIHEETTSNTFYLHSHNYSQHSTENPTQPTFSSDFQPNPPVAQRSEAANWPSATHHYGPRRVSTFRTSSALALPPWFDDSPEGDLLGLSVCSLFCPSARAFCARLALAAVRSP